MFPWYRNLFFLRKGKECNAQIVIRSEYTEQCIPLAFHTLVWFVCHRMSILLGPFMQNTEQNQCQTFLYKVSFCYGHKAYIATHERLLCATDASVVKDCTHVDITYIQYILRQYIHAFPTPKANLHAWVSSGRHLGQQTYIKVTSLAAKPLHGPREKLVHTDEGSITWNFPPLHIWQIYIQGQYISRISIPEVLWNKSFKTYEAS